MKLILAMAMLASFGCTTYTSAGPLGTLKAGDPVLVYLGTGGETHLYECRAGDGMKENPTVCTRVKLK